MITAEEARKVSKGNAIAKSMAVIEREINKAIEGGRNYCYYLNGNPKLPNETREYYVSLGYKFERCSDGINLMINWDED